VDVAVPEVPVEEEPGAREARRGRAANLEIEFRQRRDRHPDVEFVGDADLADRLSTYNRPFFCCLRRKQRPDFLQSMQLS